MKRNIRVELSVSGITELLEKLEDYQKWLEKKCDELAEKLAQRGFAVAQVILANHVYSGQTLASLKVERVDEATYVVSAESEAILFIEFGSGLRGYGHPEPGDYGPGTYPGKGHWNDPNGWWYPTDDPVLAVRTNSKGEMWGHSYGMAPAMPMYTAVKTLEQELQSICNEVFK